jgi:hypothetical protein
MQCNMWRFLERNCPAEKPKFNIALKNLARLL